MIRLIIKTLGYHLSRFLKSRKIGDQLASRQEIDAIVSDILDVNYTDMETNNQVPTMREQLITILQRCGFAIQETDNELFFTYEGMNMLIYITADTTYLGINMPNICDVNEGNELKVSRWVNYLNSNLKYIKCFNPHGDAVWISYEHQLAHDEVIAEALVASMLELLIHAYMQFRNLEEKEEHA